MMRYRVVVAALALALALPSPSAAQTTTASPADVVVTGRGIDADPAAQAYGAVTIDRARLTSIASGRLEDALADVAGLQSFRRADSRSANPTSQGISLRGLGGNASSRALLILDGVPQNDPFAGWIAFPAYAPGRLGAVRVVRGGGSGLWGAGALTGVVELESAAPGDLAPVAGSIAYGTDRQVDAGADAMLVRPGGFATLSANYARGDGFYPIIAADRGFVDGRAPYGQASGAVRGVVDLGGETELQTMLQAFTDRRTRGLANTEISSEGADASARLVGRGRTRWQALGYVQTRAFSSRFSGVDGARTISTLTLDQYSVPATALGGRVEVEPHLAEALTVRLGGDARAVTGRTHELFSYIGATPTRRREAGGAQVTVGGFADLTAHGGPVTIDATGRIDRWRISDGALTETVIASGVPLTNARYPTRTGTEPTGRLGLAWTAEPMLTLRAAAYRGWRLPTLNELYRPFRVGADATAANPDLTPERLRGTEIGFAYTPAATLRLTATGYIDRLDRAIANVTVAKSPPGLCPGVGAIAAVGICRQRVNLNAILARGIEVDGSWRVGQVTARLSYALTDARVRGGDGAAAMLTGLRPAQTPVRQGSATLDWVPALGWHAALTGRYVGGQWEDDLNTRRLAEAFTVDATAHVPLARRVGVTLRAENLLDATVYTGFSNFARERAHPRALWVGFGAAR